MTEQSLRRRMPGPAGGSIIAWMASAAAAQAHVKWFCAFSIARQPDGLRTVVNEDFVELVAVAVAALLFGTIVDETFVGRSLNRSLVRLRKLAPVDGDLFVRATVGFFLVSLWVLGGIILTPELTTTSPIVPGIQLALAGCLLTRRTCAATGVGIIALFAFALVRYGVFHLADYPIFLGIAAYLVAIAFRVRILGARPIDVLRWSAAITLMWASVEKWAYPEWSYPLFAAHPDLGFGFTPAYYMRAAGVVEFTLAFALLGTPLVRLSGAVILAAIFIAATASFGKLDAIGHAPIIGVLVAIALDDYSHERGKLQPVVLMPLRYGGALAAFIGLYYTLHAILYRTSIL